jgi:preprotein translocase subunit SecY
MFKTFANLFKVPELRARIFFTIALVAVARLLASIPTPGVDWNVIAHIKAESNSLLGWFDSFTGGALAQCSIGTLSIWPYISAQIIIQLLAAVVPAIGRLQREGDAGRKTLNFYIRLLTIGICLFQAGALAMGMLHPETLFGYNGAYGELVVVENPVLFVITTAIFMTGASMFIMWLADQITARGIGNGVSFLIMVNIASRLPAAISLAKMRYFGSEGAEATAQIWELLLLLAFGFVVLLGTVAITQALRKIPIHNTRSIAKGAAYGGNATYLPLRVNYAGVMPIIFAGPILSIIGMLSKLDGTNTFTATLKKVGETVSPSFGISATYVILYGALILFFTFFWVATQFNAMNISEGLKREGSYIPGIRPGMPTAEYLDAVMTRVTCIGALSLLAIAIIPLMLTGARSIPFDIANFFGGTSLLIIVGVALDTLRQLEAHLVMRNYDGFLRHGRIAGRR